MILTLLTVMVLTRNFKVTQTDEQFPILSEYLSAIERYQTLNQTVQGVKFFDVYTNSKEIYGNKSNFGLVQPSKHIQKIGRASNTPETYTDFLSLLNILRKSNISEVSSSENNEIYSDFLSLLKTFNKSEETNQLDSVDFVTEPHDFHGENRLLNIFSVINVNNDSCFVENAYGSYNGSCYIPSECEKLGGKPAGFCANQLAVCCIFKYTCGARSSLVRSYFVSPEYPKPSTGSFTCSFTYEKANKDISQVRIDFDILELLPPQNGTCIDDQLVISGQNTNSIMPIICGINNGQHVYLDVKDTVSPLMISVITNKARSRIFRLRLTQLSEQSDGCPAFNCLQYYTEVDGTFESFNYPEIGTVITMNTPGYMNNLNYAICIKKAPGYCTITYTNANDGFEYPFQLMNLDEDGSMLFPPEQAGAEIFNCPDDFLIVNGIRLCGDRLNDGALTADFRINAPVTDFSAGPFILPIRTNQNVNGRGFKLFFHQNRCLN